MKQKKGSNLYKWQRDAREGGICRACSQYRKVLTVDHIIPAAILDCLDLTGEARYEWEDNFQYLCNPCNVYKAHKIDITHHKTKRLLMELLNDL